VVVGMVIVLKIGSKHCAERGNSAHVLSIKYMAGNPRGKIRRTCAKVRTLLPFRPSRSRRPAGVPTHDMKDPLPGSRQRSRGIQASGRAAELHLRITALKHHRDVFDKVEMALSRTFGSRDAVAGFAGTSAKEQERLIRPLTDPTLYAESMTELAQDHGV
jgi:hypothetical protein